MGIKTYPEKNTKPKEKELAQSNLGKPPPTKTDEFSEKFRTAFDPPPHFRKIILRIFYKAIQPQKPYMWYIFEKPWVREYQK